MQGIWLMKDSLNIRDTIEKVVLYTVYYVLNAKGFSAGIAVKHEERKTVV